MEFTELIDLAGGGYLDVLIQVMNDVRADLLEGLRIGKQLAEADIEAIEGPVTSRPTELIV